MNTIRQLGSALDEMVKAGVFWKFDRVNARSDVSDFVAIANTKVREGGIDVKAQGPA